MTSAAAKPARRRRWPWVLAILALLLALGTWWVNRQLEPNRLTAMVLERVGTSLGLELTIAGTPEYALRPEPRLVLPNLTARQPGVAKPLLTAVRAEVSLPWDTILGGESIVITRIELQQPVVDLGALSAWQATRPSAPFELPTLTQGIELVDGRVIGDSWTVSSLMLELPELRADEPVAATLAGKFERNDLSLEFAGSLSMTKAGLASPVVLDAKGRLQQGDIDAPYQLNLAGNLDATGDDIALAVETLDFVSQSPLPDFNAVGTARLGETAALALSGELKRWPEAWPALPAPLSASTSPFAYTLAYDGASDFSTPLSLTLQQDETRLASQLVVERVLGWVDNVDASPLPPLTGELTTPSLEVGGATLEGVRISIEEDQPSASPDVQP